MKLLIDLCEKKYFVVSNLLTKKVVFKFPI